MSQQGHAEYNDSKPLLQIPKFIPFAISLLLDGVFAIQLGGLLCGEIILCNTFAGN